MEGTNSIACQLITKKIRVKERRGGIGVLIASCLRGMVYLSTCECTFLTSYANITLCERSVRRYDGKRHYFRRGVPLPQCFHEPEVRHQ